MFVKYSIGLNLQLETAVQKGSVFSLCFSISVLGYRKVWEFWYAA